MGVKLDITDIIGNRYGRLVVVGIAVAAGHKTKYMCQCDCGGFKAILRNSLLGGCTKSCGCLHKESIKKTAEMLKERRQAAEANGKVWQVDGSENGRWCRYTTPECAISELLHRCCRECQHFPHCYRRCNNTPEKCGVNDIGKRKK